MKRITNFILAGVLLLLLTGISLAQQTNNGKIVYDGDVVFIKNKKLGSSSLLPNGKTSYNYVGIIFIENGKPFVYHATEPISKCSLEDFISLSQNKDYKIKRLWDISVLTSDVVETMHTFAKAKLGEHYDSKLTLNNDQLYNAEFVYKIYQSALGILLAEPKPMNEYKHDGVSLEFLKEAYGDDIVYEKVLVIGDLYNSKYME